MKRWDTLVDGYLSLCRTRGLADSTIVQRVSNLSRWGNWMKRRRPRPQLEAVSSDLLIEYIRKRTAFRSRATVAGTVSVMRCMGNYLVQEGVWGSNPLRWIRGPKMDPRSRLPKRIGQKHLETLMTAAATSTKDYYRFLWVTILAVLYGTGIRRHELVGLNISDWNCVEGTLLVRSRKTNCERLLPVSSGTRQCIEGYLPQRQLCLEKNGRLEEAALLVRGDGARIVGPHVGMAIHRLAERAGVPLVNMHQFRHTCASDLLENGVGLPEVQQMMGHAAVTSTMRYLDIADPERRKAMERHPINEMLAGAAGEGESHERN